MALKVYIQMKQIADQHNIDAFLMEAATKSSLACLYLKEKIWLYPCPFIIEK